MKVCAIVLDYRRADLTAQCLDSLAGQVEHAIVVDNSDDRSASRDLQRRLDARDPGRPPLTRLAPPTNLGFAGGVNYALHRFEGLKDYDAVLLVNNDATLGAGAVAALARALQAASGPALAAPACTDDGMPLRLWYHAALGLVTRRRLWGAFSYLSGTCLLVPQALAAGGLFDEDFFMYGEDVELASRLRRGGIAQVVVTDARISHVGSSAEPQGGFFYEYHMARAHLLLADKLAPGAAWRIVYRACRAPLLLARAGVRSARMRSLTPLAATVKAWQSFFVRPRPTPA